MTPLAVQCEYNLHDVSLSSYIFLLGGRSERGGREYKGNVKKSSLTNNKLYILTFIAKLIILVSYYLHRKASQTSWGQVLLFTGLQISQ